MLGIVCSGFTHLFVPKVGLERVTPTSSAVANYDGRRPKAFPRPAGSEFGGLDFRHTHPPKKDL